MAWLHQMFGLFLLAVVIGDTLACSCLLTHPQEKFCNADFVMLVTSRREGKNIHEKMKTVVNRNGKEKEKFILNPVPISVRYHTTIHRIFKQTNATAEILTPTTRRGFLFSPPNDGLCGVVLDTNTKYLVSGTVRNGQLALDLCSSWVTPWAWVSKVQRKNLRSRFADNCGCQIATVTYPGMQDTLKPATSSQCIFKAYGRYADCFERQTACIFDKNSTTGGCKWHRNKHMKKCRASKHTAVVEP